MDSTAIVEIKKSAATGLPIGDLPILYALVPKESQLISLESWQYAKSPMLKKVFVKLDTVASFAAYWNLFSGENSRIFAKRETLNFLAKLDYHAAADGPPSHMTHSASLTLKTTTEWDTWNASDGVKMTQADFVSFIEDNAMDVTEPSPASMMEIARDLSVKSDAEFSSAVRTQSGGVQLSYVDNVKGSYGTGKLDIPEAFKVRFSAFDGSVPVEIAARLKFRLASGKLTIWYELIRAHKILDAEFQRACDLISEGAKTEVLMGGLI